jgi:HEAT repeat protein
LTPRLPARPIDEWVAELGGDEPRRAIWPIYRAGDEALPLLLEAARESETDRGLWASVTLAMMERGEAAPALIEAVQNRRADLADGRKVAPTWQGAVVLLGRARNPDAVPVLSELLLDPEIAHAPLVAAVRALGQIGDPSAIPAIERMLARDDLPVDRELQVSYIRKEEQRARPAPEVTEDARYELDLTAAEALARLGQARLDIVERYKEDPRAYVRRFAARVQAAARVAPAPGDAKGEE